MEMFRQSSVRQKPSKNTIKFVLCWPSIARHREGLPLNMVCTPRHHWKNDLLCSSYQLDIASGLGVGAGSTSLSILDSIDLRSM